VFRAGRATKGESLDEPVAELGEGEEGEAEDAEEGPHVLVEDFEEAGGVRGLTEVEVGKQVEVFVLVCGDYKGGEEVGDEHQGARACYPLPLGPREEVTLEVPTEGTHLLLAVEQGEDY